ncbi:hypothetical protein BC826DRAFT_159087 [Russula brevipes]|nr:hypothetical protein BC826DRAFT_159087 [Russula brevipes]
MSSESHQDAGAHRVERKLPPPFPYSMRYPEPDPSDPFAPLSVLRDRTATLTNSPYESPVAIPDSTPASSRMLDLATFVVHQRSKSTALGFPSAESGWQGHASQLRKGASMGLRVNEYAPGTEAPAATMTSTTLGPSATETQRHEARRRSQSVFALRSGTFSFLDSRAVPGPQHNAESSTRRHSLSPYGSRASVATSSSTSSGNSTRRERRTSGASARPRSCSSSFVSATLLDGVSEQLDGAVPLRKDMHVMQVDIPATRGDEKCSEGLPRALPPPPLDKRSPSVSSTGSWSRDLPFYSATSRPQTPSSIRSSRPVSLPPTSVFSFPVTSVTHPPSKPPPFTTSPVTPATHRTTPIPSTLATSLPHSVSNSRRVSTPRDTLPLPLNFRFPNQSAESEPESVERDGGRFARLRARKSIALQTRRSSTSSSLRSTLRAAAEAADKLAAEDASLPAPPEVTLPPKVAQKLVVVPENTRTTSLTAGTSPRSNELEEYPRVGPQTGGWECGAEPSVSAPPIMHASPQCSTDSVQVAHTQVAANATRHCPPKAEVKAGPCLHPHFTNDRHRGVLTWLCLVAVPRRRYHCRALCRARPRLPHIPSLW